MLPRDFEQVTRVEAESIGPPGQRRFRLTIENDDECVYLWLEKQHLQALGHAFEQILTHLQVVQVEIPFDLPERRWSSGPTSSRSDAFRSAMTKSGNWSY
ncbi:MAG: DUF3090 family protein [Thermomicrobiales bacterium]